MGIRQAGTAVRARADILPSSEVSRAPLEAAAVEGLIAAFDCLPIGVLLTDPTARILLRNRHAAQSLGAGSGIHERNGRLRCDFAEDSVALARALEHLLDAGQVGSIALTPRRSDGLRPLELMLNPSRKGRSVTIFISDPEQRAGFNAALARQLYGLSQREIEVARAVVAGGTLSDIAASLHVERETVRSHLKQIFSKTRTTRQADLVRLFSTGLFGVGVEA